MCEWKVNSIDRNYISPPCVVTWRRNGDWGELVAAAVGVFEARVDRGEGGSEIVAQGGDRGDDHHRDQRRDQAVFDRGGAGLVLEEAVKRLHGGTPGRFVVVRSIPHLDEETANGERPRPRGTGRPGTAAYAAVCSTTEMTQRRPSGPTALGGACRDRTRHTKLRA
jgi:hypothetical protein